MLLLDILLRTEQLLLMIIKLLFKTTMLTSKPSLYGVVKIIAHLIMVKFISQLNHVMLKCLLLRIKNSLLDNI